ncbi:MAG: HD domain-containing phosphohydrolase [Candidatus Omnitrophota bacterium]|jgi:PAS domain S-box-containing protein
MKKISARRKTAYLEAFFEHAPDMIYFKDLDNRFVLVNKAHAAALNLTPEDVIGKSDLDFFPPGLGEKYYSDDSEVIRTGKAIIGKIEKAPRSDGGITYVSTTKFPHYDKKGKIIGIMGITRNLTDFANLEEGRLSMAISALTVLGKSLELRDPYTFSHTRQVGSIAEKIAQTLGWEDNRLLGIKLAGQLHDLGKMNIPLDILYKSGKLTDAEYRLVQQHVMTCYELIKDIVFPFPLAEVILQHHERLDGSGYPRGLKGEDVIPEARILAVSDVLESMASRRPYREALGLEKACEELKNGADSKYDAGLVEVVFSLINENKGERFWLTN